MTAPGRAGLSRALFQAAWRVKHLVRPLVPAGIRQAVARSLLRRAYPGGAAGQAAVSRPEALTHAAYGLNVLGYLRAESGVAEGARCTLRACRAAGVPVAAIDYARASPSRATEPLPQGLPTTPVYGTTLVHLNADQCAFAIVDHADALTGRYRIACWNWELPEFPDRWPEAEQSVDEVWAPSRFCADAFSRRLRVPVTHMPYAIDVPVPAGASRETFGLPAHAFVFVFVFDAFSVPARKNPLGIVEAYRRMRAAGTPDTHLVLKVINADARSPLGRELAGAASSDPTITVVDRYLARADLNALLSTADAYVSLHRSEGFGFTMAEAMALGKPVVATGWSGNMDFMTADNACPVDYRLVGLGADHGPYAQGQTWADPDVAHAASLMRRLAGDRDYARALGTRAAADIRAQLAPAVVGRRIAARLDAINGR